MRAVVDANIWVSALVNPYGAPAAVLDELRQKRFTLVCSEPMLSELGVVLRRARIARLCRMDQQDVHEMQRFLRTEAEMVTITGSLRLSRDPDDNKVIETAVRGRASRIVSHDATDLLDPLLEEPLANLGISAVRAKVFLELLREQE